LTDLAQKVAPSFEFKIEPKTATAELNADGVTVTVTFVLENRGSYSINISPRHFVVTDHLVTELYYKAEFFEPLNEPVETAGFDTVKALHPGETRRHTFRVKLRNKPQTTVYYQMAYEASTDANIVTLVRGAFAALSLPFDDISEVRSFPLFSGSLTFLYSYLQGSSSRTVIEKRLARTG
jgi:hypothetical protein